MKKTLITCLILSAAFLVMALPVQAVVRYVPSVYSTIQAAVNAAGNGDTVEIAAGTYTEGFVNVLAVAGRTSLTIKGAGGAGDDTVATILDPPAGQCIINYMAGLTVTDMKMKGKGSQNVGAGILTQAGNGNLTFERLTLEGNGGHGLVLNSGENMANVVIRDCKVTGHNHSLRVAHNCMSLDGLTVENCNVDGNSYGVYIILNNTTTGRGPVKNALIKNSTFNNNIYGIVAMRLSDSTITGCTVSGCSGDGIYVYYASGANVQVHYSNIAGNTGYNLAASVPVDATLNWWGTDDAAAIASKIAGPATYIEFLCEPYPTTKVSVNGQCCTPTPLGPGTGRDGIDNDCDGSTDEADEDVTAPTVTCNLTVTSLWPPNHNMVNVGTITATDDCGGTPIIAVTVTQDEPVEDKTGDGKFSPDANGNGGALSLRAERKGNGDGRVYCISVTATDAAGNVGTCSSTVTVPHSQSKPAVNSGCIYPSSGPVIGPKQ